jgi:hypothetical protein
MSRSSPFGDSTIIRKVVAGSPNLLMWIISGIRSEGRRVALLNFLSMALHLLAVCASSCRISATGLLGSPAPEYHPVLGLVPLSLPTNTDMSVLKMFSPVDQLLTHAVAKASIGTVNSIHSGSKASPQIIRCNGLLLESWAILGHPPAGWAQHA